jgi:hypothetical protein
MSSKTDLSRNQAIQNQRNSFSREFLLTFNVETLQAFGALFQTPQYYRKFLYYKTKRLCNYFLNRARDNTFFNALVSADKGYTPLNLSDNIISDIVKPNIPDTIANIKQKSLHGRYFKELEQPEVNIQASHAWLKKSNIHPETEGFIFAI